MASGASVNATLEDAINDPFFGEREAIALSFGENGSPTNEETDAALLDGRRPADRARSRWSCPTPTSRASTPTRSSTSRPPTSSATWAGDQRSIEHRLLLVHRPGRHPDQLPAHVGRPHTVRGACRHAPTDYNQGPFDTYLAIYDSSGQVIAYNDDSFQDTDSTIIDLTLPTTGTYYVDGDLFSQVGGTRASR